MGALPASEHSRKIEFNTGWTGHELLFLVFTRVRVVNVLRWDFEQCDENFLASLKKELMPGPACRNWLDHDQK